MSRSKWVILNLAKSGLKTTLVKSCLLVLMLAFPATPMLFFHVFGDSWKEGGGNREEGEGEGERERWKGGREDVGWTGKEERGEKGEGGGKEGGKRVRWERGWYHEGLEQC